MLSKTDQHADKMKLFTIKSIETIKYCQEYVGFSLRSVWRAKRVSKSELSFEYFCLCHNYCFDFIWFVLYVV